MKNQLLGRISFLFFYFVFVTNYLFASLENIFSIQQIQDSKFNFIAIKENTDVFVKKNGSRWKKTSKILDIPINSQLNTEAYSFQNISYCSNQCATHSDELLFTFKYRGIYSSFDYANSWQKTKYALRREVDFDPKAERKVMAISNQHKFIIHKHDLLMVKNNGDIIKLNHNLKSSEYFTAVAFHNNNIYLGSSVNGLYKANYSDPNKILTFHSFSAGLPFIPHSKNINFYEDIEAIHVTDNGDIWIGTGLSNGLFVKYNNSNSFVPVTLVKDFSIESIYSISSSNNGSIIWVSSSEGLFILNKLVKNNLVTYSISFFVVDNIFNSVPSKINFVFIQDQRNKNLFAWFKKSSKDIISYKKNKIKKADHKYLLYSSGFNWSEKFIKIKKMLKGDIYNGIVIDVKDDNGYIRYNSEIEFGKNIKSIRPLYNLDDLVKYLHNSSKYIVARIVIFKDPVLYNISGYPILDKQTNEPWVGTPGERWLDPYNDNLSKKYYIPLVQELEKKGVDEIQLDYIRFPSDGNIWNTKYSSKPSNTIYQSEGLENFLFKIREATNLPISLDIYGYNGLYKAPGLIGQDVEVYGYHADIIAPMLYSSHFGDWYMSDGVKENRVYNLLNICAKKYNYLAKNNYIVRPWLQVFDMKTGIWGYGNRYISDQVKATKENGTNGFMFWGNINQMQKGEEALNEASISLTK